MLRFFDELSLGIKNLGQIGEVQSFILHPALLLELVKINIIHLSKLKQPCRGIH